MKNFLCHIRIGFINLLKLIFCLIIIVLPIVIACVSSWALSKVIPICLAVLCGVIVTLAGYWILYMISMAFEAAQYYNLTNNRYKN